MKRSIPILAGTGVALALAVLVAPRARVRHDDSPAFTASLASAVDRLENGSRAIQGATAVLLNATAPAAAAQGMTMAGQLTCAAAQYTCNARYTCDTYDPNQPGCRVMPTSGPAVHTCQIGAYTCQSFTCQTYDPKFFTCDASETHCPAHTMQLDPHTCQAPCNQFTFDITRDPRRLTCDAAEPACSSTTFRYNEPTCYPSDQSQCFSYQAACKTIEFVCAPGFPYRPCTSQVYSTCDPNNPACTVGVERTDWGKIKSDYR